MLTSNSHAVLYSMTSYKTSYLKAHYPVEFLLANLMAEVKSNAPDAGSNINKIKKELKAHKVKISPPDINSSNLTYTISEGNKLLTGLDSLKFVGDDAIKDIIQKRPFKSFFDFMHRVDSKKVRANSIQALAAAGALEKFGIPRKLIFLYCSDFRKKLQVWLKKHDPQQEEFIYPWPSEPDWSLSEQYALEQYYLGESFICKAPEAYGKFFKSPHHVIYEIKKANNKTKISPIKGIVKDFFEFKVKKETSSYYGQSMVKAIIEDKEGDQCSCTIFPDRWQLIQKRLKELNSKAIFDVGLALSFSGSVNTYEDEVGIILEELLDISPIPALPTDLKAKRVNLKEAKLKNKEPVTEAKNVLDEIEDLLYDEGLIDLDTDPDND
jgi:DNA polymerase-3 subunit alpha